STYLRSCPTRRSSDLESEEKGFDEVAGSKQELERRIGAPVAHFAYPGGQFTSRVVDLVERAGYRYAYTACDHVDERRPALTIQRSEEHTSELQSRVDL